jgi:hypothetical protein
MKKRMKQFTLPVNYLESSIAVSDISPSRWQVLRGTLDEAIARRRLD